MKLKLDALVSHFSVLKVLSIVDSSLMTGVVFKRILKAAVNCVLTSNKERSVASQH